MRRGTRGRPCSLLADAAPTPDSLTLHAPGAGGALGYGVGVAAVPAVRDGLFVRGFKMRAHIDLMMDIAPEIRMSIPTHVPAPAAARGGGGGGGAG